MIFSCMYGYIYDRQQQTHENGIVRADPPLSTVIGHLACFHKYKCSYTLLLGCLLHFDFQGKVFPQPLRLV